MLINKIGIKITEKEPDDLPRSNNFQRYCSYIGKARSNKSFYIQKEDISCPLARYNLGLDKYKEIDINKLATTLVNWNDAETEEKASNYLRETFTLDYASEKYISLFPVDQNNMKNEPDLVLVIDTPDEFMPVLRELCKNTGKWGKFYMSGIGGMCAETTAIPLKKNKPNVSLGCGGSRPHGKLEDDQLLLALPYKVYKQINRNKEVL